LGSSSSSALLEAWEGSSVKRTDLETGRGFLEDAAAKSGAREGSFGCEEMDVLAEDEENCEVRSWSWVRRRGSCEDIDLEWLSISTISPDLAHRILSNALILVVCDL
jgi:hypothetical protein